MSNSITLLLFVQYQVNIFIKVKLNVQKNLSNLNFYYFIYLVRSHIEEPESHFFHVFPDNWININ